jgi:hypothetical protein
MAKRAIPLLAALGSHAGNGASPAVQRSMRL